MEKNIGCAWHSVRLSQVFASEFCNCSEERLLKSFLDSMFTACFACWKVWAFIGKLHWDEILTWSYSSVRFDSGDLHHFLVLVNIYYSVWTIKWNQLEESRYCCRIACLETNKQTNWNNNNKNNNQPTKTTNNNKKNIILFKKKKTFCRF